MAARTRRSRFFLYMALAFLAIALLGFSTTFFIPLARNTFRAPAVIHVHGALLFAWLLFLILQASLINQRQVLTHRRLGWYGVALSAAIIVSGIAVGLHATRRDLVGGPDPFVLGQLVNILIEMALFGGLVAAAVVLRRDGESHKRLLLLATISILAPAWMRLRHIFTSVPQPFLTFAVLADSLLLVAIARDWFAYRRVHPVYLWAGGAMVAVHAIEVAAMESAPWQRFATWLLEVSAP